jgi:arginine N-succinyltransferase
MLIMRPIRKEDLDGLLNLLQESGHGLTSLPKDPEVLLKRIHKSVNSFIQPDVSSPSGELYTFVMEDIFRGEIVGISGIVSKIGGFEPRYYYELHEKTYTSKILGKSHTVRTLKPTKTHSGPTEICSLFLSSKHRSHQNGRLLSLSRFLFMAEHPSRFEREVIAEMRGVVDDSGFSPFFEVVGKKFFQIPFPEADLLTMKTKAFIEELLPPEPIIVELLPKDAQAVVAEVHPSTLPAKKILEYEGFRTNKLVGIFEPGPVLEAEIHNVRSVRESMIKIITEIRSNISEDHPSYIISNRKSSEFKSCVGKTIIDKDNIIISDVVASALKLRIGDSIRIVNFK